MNHDRPTIRVVGDDVGWHLRWFAGGRLWGEILDSFKRRFEPQRESCYFESASKTWFVAYWERERLYDWLDSWFAEDAIQWEDRRTRHNGGRSYSNGQSGSGSYRHGGASSGQTTIEAAYATLHLLPSAPAELVTAAHRVMVKMTHPDAGGDHEAAVAVNRAIETIREHQRRTAS